MDFCDMGSLADVLNTSLLRHHAGKVAMPAILHCLLEVASALHYLHSIGGALRRGASAAWWWALVARTQQTEHCTVLLGPRSC